MCKESWSDEASTMVRWGPDGEELNIGMTKSLFWFWTIALCAAWRLHTWHTFPIKTTE